MDAWTALGGGGGAAAPQEPDVRSLAYADGDAVGFHVALTLPAICMKCAGRDDIGWSEFKIRVRADTLAQVGRMLAGQEAGAQVANQKLSLKLPICGRCADVARRVRRLRLVPILLPVAALALLFAFAAFGLEALSLPLLLLTLIAWPALVIWLRFRAADADVTLERLDEDGTIRLRGVHHDTASAIVEAATGRPA